MADPSSITEQIRNLCVTCGENEEDFDRWLLVREAAAVEQASRDLPQQINDSPDPLTAVRHWLRSRAGLIRRST